MISGDKPESARPRTAHPQMQELTARIRERHWDEDDMDSPMVKAIEGKGIFPHRREINISFITSLLDKTAGRKPVLCPVENFQEPKTIAYQCERRAGRLGPGGIGDWQPLGFIIPVLIPPRGGKRRLAAVLRMVDADNPPEIVAGRADSDHPGLIWKKEIDFDWIYDGKGYEEAKEHRDEARTLSLKIAMAVAMADGSLDSAEGGLMQRWIKREISPYEEEERERLKNLYNTALRESFAEAKRGELDIDELASRLNEIGEKPIKYDAMELCFDIMSADGVAHSAETEILRRVARALELDMREVEKMRDKTVVEMGADFSEDGGAENLLGIDPNWDEARIRKHLRAEFVKWNGRLESLPAGEAREKAQRMLDLIAQERKKIGG
ncbi:MAG: TerB family tellurite resistance protein [Gammaproteobacteria bacterium]